MWKVAAMVAVMASMSIHPIALQTATCSRGDAGFGLCVDTSAGGQSVAIGGTESRPATGGGETGSGSATPPIDRGETPDGTESGVDPTAITDTLGACRSDRCGNNGTPAITLTDLASFTPTTPAIHMEPDGWALRGRPANAVAETTANSHDGTLLGRPITVRFTPTSYHWNWGDGTSSTSSTPGGTWKDLGLPRFSETDTSHTYTRRGAVTITLTIDYTVEYRSGNSADWTTVTGTVASTTNTSTYVGTAKTVNVPDDCNARPDGPGC